MRYGAIVVSAVLALNLLAAEVLAQSSADTNTRVVKVAAAKPEFAIAQDYFVQLLRKALEAGASGRAVPVIHETVLMEQDLGVYEMIRGKKVDVYWMGTNAERERRLRPVRIPLDRGLIGHRRFIIQKRLQGAFDGITELKALTSYYACQGVDWPDTKAMRAAGLKVREITNVERIFDEVSTLHCEYFPRGYFEGYSEVEQRKDEYPELMFYEHLILQYPFALYFFVNPKDEELARWIEAGLEKMLDDGSFIAHMESHPLTRIVFPLNKVKHLRWIQIDNPEMPAGIDYNNPRYWFQPDDFK